MCQQLPIPEPPPAPAYAPGALARETSPTYHGFRTSRDVDHAELLRIVRTRYPGRVIYTSAAYIERVGAAPDLQVHKYAQPNELFVEQENAR